MTFNQLKVGDRVKTKHSGMATVLQVGSYKGTMVKLKCDKPRWACPYFYESELELDIEEDEKIYKRISDMPEFMNPIGTDMLKNIHE